MTESVDSIKSVDMDAIYPGNMTSDPAHRICKIPVALKKVRQKLLHAQKRRKEK